VAAVFVPRPGESVGREIVTEYTVPDQRSAGDQQRSHTARLLACAGWADRAWQELAAARAEREAQGRKDQTSGR
jgi:hypothetical protein